MSRKGDCWDNAVAESFFKTLKTELVDYADFAIQAEACRAIFEFIEVWYKPPAPALAPRLQEPHRV